MTEIQYKRWKDFAIRMAWRGFEGIPRASKRKVAGFVKDFFRLLDSDYFHLNEILPVDWDEKWKTDNNSILRPLEFLRDRVSCWDDTADHPTWRDSFGHSTIGPFICDIVTEQMEHWNPHYWDEYDRQYNRWDEFWGSRIRCCLRAGLDCAADPSAGVVGFTIGTLRRMYRGRIPEWLDQGFVSTDEIPVSLNTLPDAEAVWL